MSRRDRSNLGWSAVPEEVLDDFDSYLAGVDRHVTLIRPFSEGLSGASVLLVEDRVGRRAPRQRVLKFCLDAAEPDRIFVVYDELAEFAERHLAKPVDKVKLDRCSAVFMEVAGQDWKGCRPLADYLNRSDLATTFRTIVPSLINGWNAGRTDLDRPCTVADFLCSLIGRERLEVGGRLDAFAARVGIDRHAGTLRLPGWRRELRNPLAFADLNTPAGAFRLPGGALIGNGHGDPNIFNLLIPGFPDFEPERYQVIDYGSHSVDRPVTWDSMLLLVSMATRWLGQLNPTSDAAQGLIRTLVRPHESESGFGLSEHQGVTKAVYEAGYEWARDKSYGDRWRPQCALSLCAAGLIFVGRKVPGIEGSLDNWFFKLAAEAAEEFAELVGAPDPVMNFALPGRDRKPRVDGVPGGAHNAGRSSGIEACKPPVSSNFKSGESVEVDEFSALLKALERRSRLSGGSAASPTSKGFLPAVSGVMKFLGGIYAYYPAKFTAYVAEITDDSPSLSAKLLEGMPPSRAADVLERLSPKAAVAVLVEMCSRCRKTVLLHTPRTFWCAVLNVMSIDGPDFSQSSAE
ncbi:hypothetical protein [Streptosporangium sp. NPDC006007]|uniref:hypothetical protein n=1 Tax=Streptosporangium sp. NPDC006007 TaxID=3154575 RepID=UPI0033A5BB2A